MIDLEELRAELEERHGPTPHFDPLDGGADARVLLLLETPGPGRETLRFVSRDNPTVTAANIRRFSTAAALDRRDTVIWNTVPWVVYAPGARNRSLRRSEIKLGLAELPGLLLRLPRLDTVVLAGRVAAAAEGAVRRERPSIAVLRMPHPSPTYVNTSPAIAGTIVEVLRQAARKRAAGV